MTEEAPAAAAPAAAPKVISFFFSNIVCIFLKHPTYIIEMLDLAESFDFRQISLFFFSVCDFTIFSIVQPSDYVFNP